MKLEGSRCWRAKGLQEVKKISRSPLWLTVDREGRRPQRGSVNRGITFRSATRGGLESSGAHGQAVSMALA